MKTLTWLLPLAAWILAPLLFGIINRVKSMFAGRKGPPLMQGYFDVAKLLRKGTVYGGTTGPVFRMAPVVVLAAMLVTTFIVPWGGLSAPLSFRGDFVLLAYLLGLARFATVLAALDTGSAFEGMGASREVQFAALGEPTLLLGMMLLVVHTGHASLSEMIQSVTPETWQSSHAAFVLLIGAWTILLLTENARIPVDDPNTHLELTMIHEVMLLDTGGPDLGIMTYASSLKLWIFSALLSGLIVPAHPQPFWLQIPLFLAGMFIVVAAVGIVESTMGRLRLVRVPKLLIGSMVLVATALIIKLAS